MAVEKRFQVSLDIKRSTSNRDFEVVEGDNGNVLEVTLTDNGQAVDLRECYVCAIFSKSDGKTVQQDTQGNGIELEGENKLIIKLYNTSFSPGLVECELQVFSGEQKQNLVTSAKFNFKCRRGIANADTIQSTDEWPLLVGLIQNVQGLEDDLVTLNQQTAEAVENANAAANTANTAAAQALETAATAAEQAINTANAAASAVNATGAAVAQAEQARALAEQLREQQENERVQNETERDIAEEAREEAEERRAQEAELAILSANTAANRANAAAEAAEEVVTGALPPHAFTHAAGGTDPITPESIGAAQENHTQGMATITGLEDALSSKASASDVAPLTFTFDIPASGWSQNATTGLYEATVSVQGMQASYTPVGDINAPTATLEQFKEYEEAWALVKSMTTANGSVKIRAEQALTVTVPVLLKVR